MIKQKIKPQVKNKFGKNYKPVQHKRIKYPVDFVPTRQSVPVRINGVTFNVIT